jgi:hypothetical protein
LSVRQFNGKVKKKDAFRRFCENDLRILNQVSAAIKIFYSCRIATIGIIGDTAHYGRLTKSSDGQCSSGGHDSFQPAPFVLKKGGRSSTGGGFVLPNSARCIQKPKRIF